MTTIDLGAALGHQAVLRVAHSALPDAPVVPDAEPRRARLRRSRTVTAAALHRAAHRVAPAT